jgi:LmbE family N-acetylglucosaminyl deacetylase
MALKLLLFGIFSTNKRHQIFMLKLMCVLAHPDDESLGTGGVLARYAAEGVETYLVTATRGERGWMGDPAENPGLQTLGQMRTAELLAASDVLGIQEVNFLDYIDGDVDQADPVEAAAKIANHLRRVRPDVVITFDPYGAYGHPDHIAICQFTLAAVVAAAASDYAGAEGHLPHQVRKLYFMAYTLEDVEFYESIFGRLVMTIDGQERMASGWPAWALTTQVDTTVYSPQVWQAVQCHRSQIPAYEVLEDLTEAEHRRLWGTATFYRAFSLVNSGRAVEKDLFEGLR